MYVDFNQTVNELSQLRRDLSEGKLKTLGDGVAEVELVMDDGSLYPNKGQLLFTGVQVNPGTGQVQLRATFPNPDHYLLPGMYLQVRLARASVDDAIFVPNQAIQRTSEGGSKVMLVDEENVVRDSPVVLGQEFGGRTLVLSGVKVGDKVITEGFTKIRTGQTVRPQLKGAAQQAQQEQQAQPAETAASQAPAEQSEQGADTEAAAVAQ